MIRTLAAVLMVAAMAAPLGAQTNTSVAAFRDWSVFNPSDPVECYIVSPPVKSEAFNSGGEAISVRRGQIRLFVTIRPSDGVDKEISFLGGYPFRPGSTIDVAISGTVFTLSPGTGESEEWAWPPSPARDKELVDAMQKGAGATITAFSRRGNRTVDTFSLLGFSAALEKAEELCN